MSSDPHARVSPADQEAARRDLVDFVSQAARRITAFLNDRVAVLDNPRSTGRALGGSDLGGFLRYRVGDYRILTAIEDRTLQILVVAGRPSAGGLPSTVLIGTFWKRGHSRGTGRADRKC